MSTVCSKSAVSKLPSARRNFIRLIEARLQAESSTCMYSEHGLEALIRPDSGQVCQSLIVVSYWTPGIGAAPGGLGDLARAGRGPSASSIAAPSLRAVRSQSESASTALHELVGDADRVVRVLVLDRGEAVAVDRHVEAGVAQRRGLVLLARPCTR